MDTTGERPAMSRANATDHLPRPHLLVQPRTDGAPEWFVKWRHPRPDGTIRQVKRRVAPAWLVHNGSEWVKRPGRATGDHLERAAAQAAAFDLVRTADAELTAQEHAAVVEASRPVTFREIAHAYLEHVQHTKGAKPSTLSMYRSALAEPGVKHRRGAGVTEGLVMRSFGDRAAAEISTREVDEFLKARAKSTTKAGKPVKPRTVNRDRQLLSAIFTWAAQEKTFGLPRNPVREAAKRREPLTTTQRDYTLEEVEALARACAEGARRVPRAKRRPKGVTERTPETVGPAEIAARRAEDERDAEAVRLAAYTGLRAGELVALQWRDVDFGRRKLRVQRAVSGGEEQDSTKSGRHREVPMPDPVVGALDRLSRRPMFTGPDDYVLCGRDGRRLEPGALSKRVVKSMEAAGLRRVRFHDLRHTYGSLLVGAGVDLVTVKNAMGHAKLATTERYLHARDASELASRFTAAFSAPSPNTSTPIAEEASR